MLSYSVICRSMEADYVPCQWRRTLVPSSVCDSIRAAAIQQRISVSSYSDLARFDSRRTPASFPVCNKDCSNCVQASHLKYEFRFPSSLISVSYFEETCRVDDIEAW